MPLYSHDTLRIAKLSYLRISADQEPLMTKQLNDFFGLVEQMQTVDTNGVEPLAHPTAIMQEVALRLNEDNTQDLPHREILMHNAPAQSDGVFLVPRVIE